MSSQRTFNYLRTLLNLGILFVSFTMLSQVTEWAEFYFEQFRTALE
jgi:hypothetical protein